MIREFRVSLVLCVNVLCEEDESLEVARAKAGQQVDELRQTIPCETFVDGFPKTVEEIIKETAPKIEIDIEKLKTEKLEKYEEYLKYLSDEFLGYEFNDRGLDDDISRDREVMIGMLVDWAEDTLFVDPFFNLTMDYK